jgi:hypothetical protein
MWGDRQMKSFLTLSILDCEFAVIDQRSVLSEECSSPSLCIGLE